MTTTPTTTDATTNASASLPATTNTTLFEWVGEMAKLTQPDHIVWCDGSDAERRRLTEHAVATGVLKPLDPKKLPEVNAPSGEPFRLACSQCHVLPDPQRHTAKEWREVVARMERNMEWMNRVVGSQPTRGEPQLRVEDINAFLQKYARKSL